MTASTSAARIHTIYLAVAAGAALGGGGRYLLGLLLPTTDWPWPTLVANVTGSLLIGLYSALPTSHRWSQGALHGFVTAGLCGGLTTFSVFSLEVIQWMSNQPLAALIWLLLSVCSWLTAVMLGYWMGKSLLSA